MKTQQMLVIKGVCPVCNNKLNSVAQYDYDNAFVNPNNKTTFEACTSCRRLWEREERNGGTRITDIGGALSEIDQQEKKHAS